MHKNTTNKQLAGQMSKDVFHFFVSLFDTTTLHTGRNIESGHTMHKQMLRKNKNQDKNEII